LNEKCTELERLQIGREDTENTAALINEKWKDVRGQFQHFQKGSKEKIVPDSKMVCIDSNNANCIGALESSLCECVWV
jgi:hypothetical protein